MHAGIGPSEVAGLDEIFGKLSDPFDGITSKTNIIEKLIVSF